jgi:antitoxin component YwqK of YwqJK toxin-antitoxin module
MLLFALTATVACGSGPSGPKPAPPEPKSVEPGVVAAAPPPVDAAPPPDAPTGPKLVCDPGTSETPAPAPEPTWFCARPDGVREGPYITLYPDGAIAEKGSYKNGKLDGPWQELHPNGQLARVGLYVAGMPDGHWRQLSPSGQVLGEYDLLRGNGIERRWYDTGTLYSEIALKGGVPNGKLELRDPDGNVVVTAKLANGKLDGPHTVGTRSTLRIEETFVQGVRRGPRQIWQFTVLVFEEAYDRRGKLDGPYTQWRDRKIPRVQGVWDHGRRIGTWTWFDRSNNIERQGDYSDGKKTGPWFEWSENKLVFSGTYTDGKPDGEFTYFDRNGNELGRFEIHDGTGVMQTFWPNHRVASKQKLYQGNEEGAYEELSFRGKTLVRGRFSSGKKHGHWHEQDELDVPQLDEDWKHGKLDGTVKKYSSGKVVLEAHYKDGKAEGPYTEYRDGKPALVGQFVDDARDGTWTQYDASGSVVLTATYKAGVLDGPWRQLVGGAVVEGQMVAGRRSGAWTRTDRAGAVQTTTYAMP